MKNDLCIFLVDDQPITNLINKKVIEVAGVCQKVFDFTNPKSALEHITEIKPHIILLDLNMPVIDGWQFLDEMNKIKHQAEVAIVTSSTRNLDKERAKGYALVTDFLIKPLNSNAIQSLVNTYRKKHP